MATKFAAPAEELKSVQLPGYLNHHVDINPQQSAGASVAKDWMERQLKEAEYANQVRANADPRVTRGGHLANVESHVRKLEANSQASYSAAMAKLKEGLSTAESRLKATVGIVPTVNAREIRDRLMALSASDRTAAVHEAFATGDKEGIGAVVGFPKLMHGCGPETISTLLDAYQQRVASNEHNSVKEHKKYIGYLEHASYVWMEFIARALEGTGIGPEYVNRMKQIAKSYDREFEE